MKIAFVLFVCLVPACALRCELGMSTRGNTGTLGNLTCSDNDDLCFTVECTYGVKEPYQVASLKGCGGSGTCSQMKYACSQLHGSRLKAVSCTECDTDYCNH